MHLTPLCGDVRVLINRAQLLGWRAGKNISKKKKAKSRSARAQGSAVVVAGAPGTTSVVTALLCWDPLAKGVPNVLRECPLAWWDDCSVLLKPTVAGSSSTLPSVLLDLPFALGVRQLHAVWPFASAAWPFDSAASAAKLTQGVRTQRRPRHNGAASRGEHRTNLRCAPFCRVAQC